MDIYIIIFIFFYILYLFPDNRVKTSFFVSIFVVGLTLLAANRGLLGTDTIMYMQYYYQLPTTFDPSSFDKEIGFSVIAILCKLFGLNSSGFFLITSLWVNIILVVVVYRFSPKNVIPALILFYCTSYLHFEFNILRHGMMVTSVWMGFSYISQKKIIKYFLWMLIGTSFHVLALMFLPFYFILQINLNKLWYLIIICGCIVAGKVLGIFQALLFILPEDNSIGHSINYYVNDYYSGLGAGAKGVSLGLLLNLVIFLYFLFYKNVINTNRLIYRNSLFCGLCFFFLLSSVGVFAERIVSLFYISLIFIVPLLIKDISKNRLSKFFFKLLYGAYCFLYLYTNLHVRGLVNEYQFIPYY